MHRPKILYYCQSLVGVGHLTASLRVVEALLPAADVDLIHGGLDTGAPLQRRGLRTLRLPTLLHDTASGGFIDPQADAPDGDGDGNGDGNGADGPAGIEAVWAARSAAIDAFLGPRYDCVVLEFYPFGRRRFKAEIMGLLRAVKAVSGPVPVFTSVREVLVPRAVEKERRMVDSVRKHIHTVFVRGDPAVIRLDETFSLAREIADRTVYTGYISPPAPAVRPPRRPQVLVSQGGGNVGRELLQAAIGAAERLPALHFVLAAGSRTSPAELEALRATVRSANVEVVPFLPDFLQQLMASRLSISMGGDNTLLDVLTARTPALAYPYQANPEQGIRIRKFAEKGLLHELGAADLEPARLAARIELALAAPAPRIDVAMDGARVTSEHILRVLATARPVA